MISVVAARYAKALADVVTEGVHASSIAQADPAAITAQLRAVDEMIETSAELKNALASPAVAPSRKRAVMARLIAPMNLSAQVRNFLFVVIDHRRTHELPDIFQSFQQVVRERQGIAEAEIFSPMALNDTQKKEMTQVLEKLTGKKVQAKFSLDAKLLGGVLVRVGDTIYDGSLRNRLDDMRERLAAE